MFTINGLGLAMNQPTFMAALPLSTQIDSKEKGLISILLSTPYEASLQSDRCFVSIFHLLPNFATIARLP